MEPQARPRRIGKQGQIIRKELFFTLLLGVSMITSVPLVTKIQSAGAADVSIKGNIMKDPKLGQALGQIINIVDQCVRQTELWEKSLDKIVKVKSEEYPDWSVAAVRNGQRLSEEGTCSMEKYHVGLCGIHEVTIFWGKHDRKCWFRNNGDGGWNNWNTSGHWTRRDNQMWIGY